MPGRVRGFYTLKKDLEEKQFQTSNPPTQLAVVMKQEEVVTQTCLQVLGELSQIMGYVGYPHLLEMPSSQGCSNSKTVVIHFLRWLLEK
jgi:hypothetical protein